MISTRWLDSGAPALRALARSLTLFVLFVGALSACGLDKLLKVDAPSRVLPADLEKPENAQIIVNGVMANFECALNQYIVVGGMIGQEFHDASVQSQWWEYDKRMVKSSSTTYATGGCQGSGGVYTPLSTARWMADHALNLLDEWSDSQVADRSKLIATTAAYAGYSYVLLGEAMCSAAVDGGPELSRAALFALAEDRFTAAISAAQGGGAPDALNLALIGRARARLNLGKKAEAAADAQLVPQGFVWKATFAADDPTRQNLVYVRNNRSNLMIVDELFRDVRFNGVSDPRVPVIDGSPRKAQDGELMMLYQGKYADAGASIPIARWAEAQLILAEAAGGQKAVDIINALHDNVGLPGFTSIDPDEIQRQIIYERRAELFAEGHHLGDLIRYDLPLHPAAGAPYQAQKGGTYGSQLCLPLPDVERFNNPNIPRA